MSLATRAMSGASPRFEVVYGKAAAEGEPQREWSADIPSAMQPSTPGASVSNCG